MKSLAFICALAAVCLQASPAIAGPAMASPYGVWRNPQGTIDVRIAPCGSGLCGTVARASPKALEDAREAGVANLLGVELLRDYKQVSPAHWDGRVYVPDMGGTFSSHIVAVSPTVLKVSGCVLGGLLCKSQLWTRI